MLTRAFVMSPRADIVNDVFACSAFGACPLTAFALGGDYVGAAVSFVSVLCSSAMLSQGVTFRAFPIPFVALLLGAVGLWVGAVVWGTGYSASVLGARYLWTFGPLVATASGLGLALWLRRRPLPLRVYGAGGVLAMLGLFAGTCAVAALARAAGI